MDLKMNYPNLRYNFGGGADSSLSAFSAYNFLRNCNYILSSQSTTDIQSKPFHILNNMPLDHQLLQSSAQDLTCINYDKSLLNNNPKSFLTPSPLLEYSHLNIYQNDEINSRNANVISPCSSLYNNATLRRHRSEKKPIPDEQKDEKYFERRRRNNQAAKKSRDARKIREDQIALRAAILEHENAILRTQVLTLREEASSLRQMLLQEKALDASSSRGSQICTL